MILRLTRDVVIPAGTILKRAADQRGGSGFVEEFVEFGPNFTGVLLVQDHPDAFASGYFESDDLTGETISTPAELDAYFERHIARP